MHGKYINIQQKPKAHLLFSYYTVTICQEHEERRNLKKTYSKWLMGSLNTQTVKSVKSLGKKHICNRFSLFTYDLQGLILHWREMNRMFNWGLIFDTVKALSALAIHEQTFRNISVRTHSIDPIHCNKCLYLIKEEMHTFKKECSEIHKSVKSLLQKTDSKWFFMEHVFSTAVWKVYKSSKLYVNTLKTVYH